MSRTVAQTIALARDAQRVVDLHLAHYVAGDTGLTHTCIALHVAARQMAAAVDLLPLSTLKRDAYRALCMRRSLIRGW